MKKVFIDTNVMIDYLAERADFYRPACQILSLAERKKIKLYASSLSFATTSYVLNRVKPTEIVNSALSGFMTLCSPTAVDASIVASALTSSFKDFEDALQYFSAVKSNMDVIVTRNKKDFQDSTLLIMEPQEFLDHLIKK